MVVSEWGLFLKSRLLAELDCSLNCPLSIARGLFRPVRMRPVLVVGEQHEEGEEGLLQRFNGYINVLRNETLLGGVSVDSHYLTFPPGFPKLDARQ